jgi:hypothetical protein
MKLDVSVAPEIAMLATDRGAAVPCPADGPAHRGGSAAGREPAGTGRPGPATIGCLAACLRSLLADPGSWWDRVRFDPDRPVHVSVGAPNPGCEAWLLVLPPGYRGDAQHPERSWQVACLVAGEVSEQASTPGGWRSRPLSPGRTRVRGGPGPYRMINAGAGYAVSLHARSVPAPHRPPAQTRAG